MNNDILVTRIKGDAALAFGEPHILLNGHIPLRDSFLLGRNQDAELSILDS